MPCCAVPGAVWTLQGKSKDTFLTLEMPESPGGGFTVRLVTLRAVWPLPDKRVKGNLAVEA